MARKPTKLAKKASGLRKKIQKTLLSIDPASGSSSNPGYAVFQEGELVASGEIDIPSSWPLNQRLQKLADKLREEFIVPDILAIEHIPPMVYGKGGLRSRSITTLHKSIGAVLSAVKCRDYIEVSSASWYSIAKSLPFEYVKTDENDAVMLGWAVLRAADITIDEEGILEFLKPKD